jgi:hypothetical protein
MNSLVLLATRVPQLKKTAPELLEFTLNNRYKSISYFFTPKF